MFQRIRYRTPGEWKTVYNGAGGAFYMQTEPRLGCARFTQNGTPTRISRKQAADLLRQLRARMAAMALGETVYTYPRWPA